MEQFAINTFIVNDEIIEFNRGINYVIGSRNTGKTIMFTLIQYVLGLKADNAQISTMNIKNLQINCNFGEKNVTVTRELTSNKLFFHGDIEEVINISEKSLHHVYNTLLRPLFAIGEDPSAAVDILRFSFLSDRHSLFSHRNSDIIMKILGINLDLLNKYEYDVDRFDNLFKTESKASHIISDFTKSIEIALRKVHIADIDLVIEIMHNEFKKRNKNMSEKKLFLKKAYDIFMELRQMCDNEFKEKITKLEEEFIRYKQILDIDNDKTLIEVCIKNPVLEIDLLLQFVALLVMNNRESVAVVNPSLFLMHDSYLDLLAYRYLKAARRLIATEFVNKLQYIEFTNSSDELQSGQIVLRLDDKEVFK